VVIIEELARFGVSALPRRTGARRGPADDAAGADAGVIAEYERAKIVERYRRGKLYRARQGEIPF
jgi:site-specific DNA recombinase